MIVDDRPVFSCLTPICVLENRQIKTIEGLGIPGNPGPVQRAFIEEQAAQCGYCTAGIMMVGAQALLDRNSSPSDAEIRRHMTPSLCRGERYVGILRAVRRAAQTMQAAAPANAGETAR